MDDSVSQLKALLFERETRELDTLNQRLATIAERAGGDDQLRRSVARIIDGALRDAEEAKHRELNQALAPVIQRTFRQEIRSPETQSELENALYPKLGVMVQRYIASAMRDLMETINRRLESGLTQNRLVLKIRSLATGRSMAELALLDTEKFKVEELYLIRRGSGELIQHWAHDAHVGPPAEGLGDNRDTLVSGFLAAITGFAEDAFADDKATLRAIELDAHRIYLRLSPAYIVAAKTSGTAEAAIERVLDAALIEIVDAHQSIESAMPSDAGPEARSLAARQHQQALGNSSRALEEAIGGAEAELKAKRGGLRPLKVLLALIGMLVAGYAGWTYYQRMLTSELQAKAEAAVQTAPGTSGYPISVRVEPGGQAIWVHGLTPSTEAREAIITELTAIAPKARLQAALGVLPQTDVDAAIEQRALQQAARSARQRVERAARDVERSSVHLPAAGKTAVDQAGQELDAAAQDLKTIPSASPAAPLSKLQEAIRSLNAAHRRLLSMADSNAILSAEIPMAQTPAEAFDMLALTAEKVASAAGVLDQVARHARSMASLEQENARLRREITDLAEKISAALPKPRDRLVAFVRSNAIFFNNGTDYREPDAVRTVLNQLSRAVLATNAVLRVVGYTDDAGSGPRNQSLSQQRAERVAAELMALGIPRNRIIAVGRSTNLDLVPRSGTSSNNRRVEFEVAFEGEEADAQ